MINFAEFKNKVWNDKIIVSIKLTNKQNAVETMHSGIKKGDQLHIIAKKDLKELIVRAMNNGFTKYNLKTGRYDKYGANAIIVIAVPDTLHKQVFDMDDNVFISFKNQFDYENNENGIGTLDELSGYYSELIWENGDYIPVYFIPSELILGYIYLDNIDKEKIEENVSFTENPRYFTKLSIQEQKKVINLIKKTYIGNPDYSKYCSLIRKRKKF